jgi:alkylhydroperoxidase/carboxymuconolactone decarboxylase family protein YurZ
VSGAELWRVGHRSDPLAFTPRPLCSWNHRFDDTERRFRTIYCAEHPETSLREVLADFHPNLAALQALFGDLTQDTIFSMLWSRDGIDLKTRTLVTAVSDIATGQTDALRLHLRFCRRHGWSEDELVEVMLHLTGYVGVPMIRQMLLVAKDTFEEMQTDGTLEDAT